MACLCNNLKKMEGLLRGVGTHDFSYAEIVTGMNENGYRLRTASRGTASPSSRRKSRQGPEPYWSERRVLVSPGSGKGGGDPGASSSCTSFTSHMTVLEKA